MQPLATYFALVLARVGTGVAVMPLFAGRNIPRLVKLGWSLALAIFWFGALEELPDLSKLKEIGDGSWAVVSFTLVREMSLGLAIGMAFNLFLVPARVAGEFVTQEMGMALANTLGPTGDRAAGPITLIFEALSGLLFLGLDLHHVFLTALHATFLRYPIGGVMPAVPVARLVDAAAAAQQSGVLVAGPLAIVLFLVVVALALLTRAAPQLNIYAVGFGLQAVAGMIASMLLMPEIVDALVRSFSRMSEQVLLVL